jgi:hypothetical protein
MYELPGDMRRSCDLLGKGPALPVEVPYEHAGNLECIQSNGLEQFLAEVRAKWVCPECGGTVCCHIGLCLSCDLWFVAQSHGYKGY